MLSFIIPAHNEESWIAACISSIYSAIENIDEPYNAVAATAGSPSSASEASTLWKT
jgi:hypothetical protein